AAVPQERAHRVHLGVAGPGVAAARVDLLEDHARRRQAETGAAVLLRDQRGEPAVLGQRADELLGIAVGLEPAPVLARKAGAQLADGGPDLELLLRRLEVHREEATAAAPSVAVCPLRRGASTPRAAIARLGSRRESAGVDRRLRRPPRGCA